MSANSSVLTDSTLAALSLGHRLKGHTFASLGVDSREILAQPISDPARGRCVEKAKLISPSTDQSRNDLPHLCPEDPGQQPRIQTAARSEAAKIHCSHPRCNRHQIGAR